MASLITPVAASFDGVYYDGTAPVRHTARIELTPEGLSVTTGSGGVMFWRYTSLRVASNGTYGDPVRLDKAGSLAGETLVVDDRSFIVGLRQFAPELPGTNAGWIEITGWPGVLLSSIAIGALALLFYFWGVRLLADTLARFTPLSWEERLGQTVVNVLAPEGLRCSDPKREQALSAIVDRLAKAAGSKYRFRVTYSNNTMVNAFAAPGGQIVVFDGLLKKAATPEEFAGVLAHEMQHVMHKHSTRAIARELSARMLLSLFAGDSGGTPAAFSAGAKLAGLSYQRSDEEEADVESIALLRKAGIQPGGLASFFDSLRISEGAIAVPAYLSTHPALPERIARLERETAGTPPAGPSLMSLEEWVQVRNICGGH